jgi:hypothetical protein
MDLQDTGSTAQYIIRDRDGKYPALFDTILADSGITVVRSGVRVPRMNAIMQRWVRTCRRELLDRTLIWNQCHLLHARREYEDFYNAHRPHQGITRASPTPDRWHHYPNRSPTTTNSPSSASTAVTVSAVSYTSTNTPPDQHGRNSRQLQGSLTFEVGVPAPRSPGPSPWRYQLLVHRFDSRVRNEFLDGLTPSGRPPHG